MSETRALTTPSATHAATDLPLRERGFFGHPAGLATLFFTEMWERLSFYGMRALLVLFLVDALPAGGLGLTDRTATAIYGLYVGATYITCLPGGWLGDRLLGAQRAVLAGGIVIAFGHLMLGIASTGRAFYLGLLVIVLGTGLLKPNASAIVAELYPQGGARLDAGFTIYYIGVNVGATLGPLLTAGVAARYGWHAGFMVASLGMSAGVVQFLWGRRRLGASGARPPAPASAGAGALRHTVPALLAVALLVTLFWSGAVHSSPERLQSFGTGLIVLIALGYFAFLLFGAGLTRPERMRIVAVMVLFIASVLFWAGYEQTGSSLNLFAERYTARAIGSFIVPAGWLQSLNPIFILIFGPMLSALWIQLGRRNLDPSAPVKFILGLIGMGLGFVVMAVAARLVVAGHRAGMGWLTTTYLLHTWGELCLSPVGMSAVSQLVPRRLIGRSLGIWFVSLALGELLAGRIAGQFSRTDLAAMPAQFLDIVYFAGACALAVAITLPWMRRWMGRASSA